MIGHWPHRGWSALKKYQGWCWNGIWENWIEVSENWVKDKKTSESLNWSHWEGLNGSWEGFRSSLKSVHMYSFSKLIELERSYNILYHVNSCVLADLNSMAENTCYHGLARHDPNAKRNVRKNSCKMLLIFAMYRKKRFSTGVLSRFINFALHNNVLFPD